ncbi:MAG: hypothetical protein JW779_01860 [Candidatus Thorarchaeota archaeon]|nr:hypothetical protein [Candidatus Thorarchaeota archaeon]
MLLKASKCPDCERISIPSRTICPYCGKKAGVSTNIEVEGLGHIITFTELHMPPEGFEPPLKMALVKLTTDTMILCLEDEANHEEIYIGAPVEISSDSSDRFTFCIKD